MVPDHWSNDAMVSMDRCGLLAHLGKWVKFEFCHFDRTQTLMSHHITLNQNRRHLIFCHCAGKADKGEDSPVGSGGGREQKSAGESEKALTTFLPSGIRAADGG